MLLAVMLAACTTTPPSWRTRAMVSIESIRQSGADKLNHQEYNNLIETFEHGEAILHVKADQKHADAYYLLAIQKSGLLADSYQKQMERLAEEARLRRIEEEAQLAEEMRIKAEAERERKERDAQAGQIMATSPNPPPRERPHLPSSHTVRRGETLPQIAARPDIYNDAALWPLIYRANRDQVRDPRQLWPGQALRIPRSFSKDDAIEARKQAARK